MLEWEEILPIRSPLWGYDFQRVFSRFTGVQVVSYRLVSTFAILVSENRKFFSKNT